MRVVVEIESKGKECTSGSLLLTFWTTSRTGSSWGVRDGVGGEGTTGQLIRVW